MNDSINQKSKLTNWMNQKSELEQNAPIQIATERINCNRFETVCLLQKLIEDIKLKLFTHSAVPFLKALTHFLKFVVWITHSSSLNKLLNWILLIKYCMNISDGILNWTICWLDYIAHAYMCGRGCRRKKPKSVPSVAKILFANVRPKIIPP